MVLMAFAMFSTAILMKPSAISSGARPSPSLRASALNALRTAPASSFWSWPGPKMCGKNSGLSLPVITLASVTVSGPLAYRRGGPLTVTDANVMTGKLRPEFFPHIFGPGQDQELDAGAVRTAFNALARKLGDARAPEEIADGFIRIAVENMANAIKTISVQRGYDVTNYVMNSFGGAGGQHACLMTDPIRIMRVLIHPLSGVLSAYGMGLASLRATRIHAVLASFDRRGLAELATIRAPLEIEVKQELMRQGVEAGAIQVTAHAHLRYAGTDSALPIPVTSLKTI